MNINFLDRPIAFHRPFVTITGSVTAALFLSQAIYWAKRCKAHEDGCFWFYKTQADWEEETGLTRYEQEGARKALRNLGVLKEKRIGLPAKLYFCIDLAALEAALNTTDFLQPSMRKSSKQASGKPADTAAGNQQSITEITTETTAEIQDPPVSPKGEKSQRGTRLPENWTLPKSWGEWAMTNLGLQRNQILLEAESFADYWQSLPGAKAVKLDWEKTWRNWIRRTHRYPGKPLTRKPEPPMPRAFGEEATPSGKPVVPAFRPRAFGE